MSARIAALPMYDFAELRAAHDALWDALGNALVESGVSDVPSHLTRDLPHRHVWRDPSLLFGQACEYPIAKSFGGVLALVATPRYSAPGCEGAFYRSAIIVRAQDPADALAAFRGRRCVVNEPDSNSGMNLLRAAVAPLACGAPFFESVHLSGSHRQSVEMVAGHEADIAAIDCVTLAHLQKLYPALVAKVRTLCWTPCSPSLPFVTAHATDERTVEVLRSALAAVVSDESLSPVRERLFLEGVDLQPDTGLGRLRQLERGAAALGYSSLA
ncbi:MAG: PhnD/SsuA/transferrin family substrate-binding protein [Gammaproteobacteria bacterium]